MQDNKYSELANEGWDKMRVILDNELPVRKRKRRTFLIFLLFFGLAGLSAVTYSLYGNKSDLKVYHKSNLTDSKVIVAENEAEKMKNQRETNTEVHPDKDLNYAAVKNEEDLIPIRVDKSDAFRETTNHVQEATNHNFTEVNFAEAGDSELSTDIVSLSTIGNSKSLIPNAGKEDHLQAYDESAIAESSKVEDVISEQQPEESLLVRQMIWHAINLPILEVSRVTATEKTIQNTIAFVNNEKYLPVSLYGDLSFGFPIRSYLYGSSFAVGLEKSVSRRWLVDVGIGVSNSRYDSNISPLGLLMKERDANLDAGEFLGDPVTYVPNQAGSVEDLLAVGNVVKPEYYEFVANKLNSLLFLDIPINLNYRITRKSSFGVGVQYSYLIAASNDRVFGISSNLAAYADTDLEEAAFYKYDLLNKHNVSISARYEYRISRNFSSYLSYEHGARIIIRSNDKSTKNRYKSQLHLGVRYRLNM